MSKSTQDEEWKEILLKRFLSRLSKLEQYYIGIPQQKEVYEVTLEELRTLYRSAKFLFSETDVKLIKKIKDKIEECPDIKTPLIHSKKSIEFVDGKLVIHTIHSKEAFELVDGNLVFHKTEYYVGQLDGTTDMKELFEDPTDTIEYRVKLPRERFRKIASAKNLLVIGNAQLEDILPNSIQEEYASYCWHCKFQITSQFKRCETCGWYICLHCGACGCGYNG